MNNWSKEAFRRFFQMIAGIFIFDMPGLNIFRNLVVWSLVCGGVKQSGGIISRHVLFYVPHGLKIEKVVLGNKVRISENVRIDCSSPLMIEDNVWISENVVILNHEHVIETRAWKEGKKVQKTQGLKLGEDCWIGAGSIILPQVEIIGKGAIVGAGSIVTKNVEPYTVVAGNPAIKIKDR